MRAVVVVGGGMREGVIKTSKQWDIKEGLEGEWVSHHLVWSPFPTNNYSKQKNTSVAIG